MEDLQNNYFFLLYFIALVLSIYRYKFYYDTILRYFPILIGYALIGEVLGLLIRDFDEFQIIYGEEYIYYNTVIFNVFDIIFFLYFYYIFRKIITTKRNKSIIAIGAMAFIGISIINPFFQDFLKLPQNYAIIIGSIVLLFAALSYILESNRKQWTTNIFFWLSIGIVGFYSLYPIIMYIVIHDFDLYQKYNLSQLHYLTITFMYTSFSIGFIKMRSVKSNSSQQQGS